MKRYLSYCPECNRENILTKVSSGICAWCSFNLHMNSWHLSMDGLPKESGYYDVAIFDGNSDDGKENNWIMSVGYWNAETQWWFLNHDYDTEESPEYPTIWKEQILPEYIDGLMERLVPDYKPAKD